MRASPGPAALAALLALAIALWGTFAAAEPAPILPPIAPPLVPETVPRPCDPPGKAWAGGLDPHRFELAGFPIVGGNSDIGFQFGAAATLTRFCGSVVPYLWNIDLLLSASAKDESGLKLVQQSHVLRLDAPDLLDGRMRLDGRTSFQRTINEGYYGLGNASTATLPAGATLGRQFQYLQQEGRARFIVRVHTHTPFDLALGANLRYESPQSYDGSKLAADVSTPQAGAPMVRGVDPAALGGLAVGAFYDTRDSEFITTTGVFYQLGLGGTVGTSDGIGYGNASAILAHYAPLYGPIIFASRLVGSFSFGNLPFYDLQQGGTFEPQYLFGGETGVRGVPNGRYAGKVMVVSNTEIRATLPRFTVWKQRLRFGVTAFFDAGRVWQDYSFNPAIDGTTLSLKYGIGGGVFLQWGEAAIFRVEAAYSPDAVAENPNFPVGLYVSDGLMF